MAAGSSYREFSDDNLLIPPLGKKNTTQIGMARTASPLWPTVLSRRALGEEGLPFSRGMSTWPWKLCFPFRATQMPHFWALASSRLGLPTL